MKQEMEKYTADDLAVWSTLFERQVKNLQTKGSEHYLNCLRNMNAVLNGNEIPDFQKINHWFESSSGWRIEVVPGLIEVDKFFELLAQKKFCSSTWLRSMKNLDYLEEPDMFHDTFGHIPLLSDPVFSEFAHEFGKLGVQLSGDEQALIELQRLYWFTIEFGVILEGEDPKVYGAGIISSFGETNKIANRNCTFLKYDLDEILAKSFKTDEMQEEYFLIESFEQLVRSLKQMKKTAVPN